MSPSFPHLLAPVTLAHVTLRCRLIMESMHCGYQCRCEHCGQMSPVTVARIAPPSSMRKLRFAKRAELAARI